MPPKQGGSKKHVILKSGNATSSKKPAEDENNNNNRPQYFPNWSGKTPLSLLYERCQKEGWLKPEVNPKKVKNEWTCQIILCKKIPKSNEIAKVIMQPPIGKDTPMGFSADSPGLAKHLAAVYALYRFSNRLQLKMTLPPQTRDYWASLESEKRKSPPNKQWLWAADPFAAAASAPSNSNSNQSSSNPNHNNNNNSNSNTNSKVHDNFRPRDNEGKIINSTLPPVSSKLWKDAPTVYMSSALRDLVDQTVRSQILPINIDNEQDDKSSKYSNNPIFQRFINQGFRIGYVESALNSLHESQHTDTDILEWLLLHLPEVDLPTKFRMSAHGGAESVLKFEEPTDVTTRWFVDEVYNNSGYPKIAILNALKKRNFDMTLTDIIYQDLQSILLDIDPPSQTLFDELKDGLSDRQSDEILALEAIYDDKFLRRSDNHYSIHLSSEHNVQLNLILSPNLLYPSPSIHALPLIYISSTTLPDYIRLYLTSISLKYIQSDLSDMLLAGLGGVVSEVIEYISKKLDQVIKRPPHSDSVFSPFTQKPTPTNSAKSTPRSLTPVSLSSRVNSQQKKPYKKAPTPEAIDKESQRLKSSFQDLKETNGWKEMVSQRRKLPAWDMKNAIVSLIESNRVTIVSGETGSGKTTQVPSFVLEHHLDNSAAANCNILVTQPRRVAAIGVASRVAQELQESINSPNLVGYAIRGERKASKSCKLLFCTTGVLLRRISSNDSQLDNISHIFVDEVHERSLDSDILLLELKRILQINKKIKIILMSATADSGLFSKYFNSNIGIHIPGRTFPVDDKYLEDIVKSTDYYAESMKAARSYSSNEMAQMQASFESIGLSDSQASTVSMISRAEKIDYGLVSATISYILNNPDLDLPSQGSILVFMPGVAEIQQCIRNIKSSTNVSQTKIDILPLHANQSSNEQNLVFNSKNRKIIVATNVAETSITIDDVVFVIDCGRVKETRFDTQSNIVKLVETWASRASCKQRRGRAGRTRPGVCFKLFTRQREDEMMGHSLAEIHRTPLESLMLQVKVARDKDNGDGDQDKSVDIAAYLSRAIEPPKIEALESSWKTLLELGAVVGPLKGQSQVSALGKHMSLLPLDLRIGKMLVLSVVFRCLDTMLTVAAYLSSKPLFITPENQRDEAQECKNKFSVSNSDPLTGVAAFNAINEQNSRKLQREFCDVNYLSYSAFMEMEMLRQEYLDAIVSTGMVPWSMSKLNNDGKERAVLNTNCANEYLLKAIIFAGTGNNVIRVAKPDARYDEVRGGVVKREEEARQFKLFEDDSIGGRVFIHPSSTMFHNNKFKKPFLSYFSLNLTSKPFLREVSEVPIYGLLFFGGKIVIDLNIGGIAISTTKERNDESQTSRSRGWAYLKAWPRIGILARKLRLALEEELQAALESPQEIYNDGDHQAISAMSKIIATDGE